MLHVGSKVSVYGFLSTFTLTSYILHTNLNTVQESTLLTDICQFSSALSSVIQRDWFREQVRNRERIYISSFYLFIVFNHTDNRTKRLSLVYVLSFKITGNKNLHKCNSSLFISVEKFCGPSIMITYYVCQADASHAHKFLIC